MRKRLPALVAAVAAATAILVPATAGPAVSAGSVTAATAPAADGYDRCPDGYYCMFSGLDGTGDMIKLRGNAPDLAALGMDDRSKSDWNRTPSTIHLWSDAQYSGCTAVTSSGPTGKGNFFPTYQDFFSSVQFDGPGGPSCGTPPGEGGRGPAR